MLSFSFPVVLLVQTCTGFGKKGFEKDTSLGLFQITPKLVHVLHSGLLI